MGKNPRKTRGEYRPIFEALFHGKDYRALSPDAKLVLLTIKGLGGALGMKVWPALVETLAELTGMPTPRAKKALSDLVKSGWVEHESGIVWVVRGLEFEPQISHGATHRAWFWNAIDALPRAAIVDRLCARYAYLFGERPSDSLSHTPSHAPSPSQSGTPSDRPDKPHAIPVQVPVPVPVPNPVPVPVRSPSLGGHAQEGGGSTLTDDARLLTIAANAGISRRYGEQPSPIHHGHRGGIEAAEALRAEGVDIEFAHAVVFAYASALTKDRPPRSVHYFTEHVIERWRDDQAKRAAAGYRGANVPAAEMDQMHTFAIRYAQQGAEEWQLYCDKREILWRAAS